MNDLINSKIGDGSQSKQKMSIVETHCWEDYLNYDNGKSYTCLLEDGHDGDHEWTDDNEISMEFGK